MSDISINYKGTEIANMSASGTKTLTTQGKYCEDNITINYTKPVPVEVEEKDVNFYDYDGTLLYSYTAQEFANLTELPANPTHSGLTAQGWNWTLSDAKTYVSDFGFLDIGQMYVTDDGKTRIYIHLEDRINPYCCFAVNGTATIEWGDGTSDIVVGTSTSTLIATQHTYAKGGDYVISLSSESTLYLITSGNMGCALLTNNKPYFSDNMMFINAIMKIELGSNIAVGQSSFTKLQNIDTITMPSSLNTTYAYYLFRYSIGLKYITINSITTQVEQYMFDQCFKLKRVSLPKSAITFNTACFQGCQCLQRICIPTNASLGLQVLAGDYYLTKLKFKNITFKNNTQRQFGENIGMKVYDFTLCTSVPTLPNSNAFSGIQSDCQIVVPDNLYNSWIAATNWSNYASYIIKESNYNA